MKSGGEEAGGWAPCACGCACGSHEAVILRPVCIERPARVLFEGVLGACLSAGCGCRLFRRAQQAMTGRDAAG
jgi:hypothetical protein